MEETHQNPKAPGNHPKAQQIAMTNSQRTRSQGKGKVLDIQQTSKPKAVQQVSIIVWEQKYQRPNTPKN